MTAGNSEQPRSDTWVLLRGLTREARHWGRFPDLLRAQMPGARIVAIDLPGNGRLHRESSPLSVPEMARYCRAELARRGVEGPVYLLAMSLGAMVASAWAASHPQELEGCVLVNTSMRPFSPFYQRLKPRHYPAIVKLAALGGTPRQWEETVLRITAHHPSDPASTLLGWVRLREECPVTPGNALRQLLAAARYSAPITAPAPPILILASSHDELVDARCSQRLAAAWQARLATHPTAGHDLPLDDGDWVATQVRQWWQELGGAQGRVLHSGYGYCPSSTDVSTRTNQLG